MPVTIKDVARESGVNVSTVSRALNGEYGVHAETREMVTAVARQREDDLDVMTREERADIALCAEQ